MDPIACSVSQGDVEVVWWWKKGARGGGWHGRGFEGLEGQGGGRDRTDM